MKCLLASLSLIFHSREFGLLFLLETLLDSLTKIFGKLFVASPADRLRVPRSEFTFLQELLAGIAKEVLLVISLVKKLLTTGSNGLLAERAIVTEELNVMSLTIRKTIVLEVMGLDEGLIANMAGEMVRMPDLAEGGNGATLAGLTALGALLQQQNLVVRGAIVVAFELVAISTLEFNTALLTSEMAWVHELAFDEQVWANNRTIAHGALMGFGTDDANFLLHAIRAINVLGLRLDLVTLTDEVGTTADTNEVLRVERESTLSIDDFTTNNVVTNLATLSMKLHEVLLTVKLVIRTNEEAAAGERLRAVLTDEVVRVIVLSKSLSNLTNDRLMAHSAIGANWDIVAHNLRLLLLHEEVGIIVASRCG